LRKLLYVAAVFVSLAAGCGDDERSESPATTQPSRVTTPTFPSLGCDVVSQCLPESIPEVLAACPARKQLEGLLPRVKYGQAAPGHEADHRAALDAYSVIAAECY
jgi:hypothetical protein